MGGRGRGGGGGGGAGNVGGGGRGHAGGGGGNGGGGNGNGGIAALLSSFARQQQQQLQQMQRALQQGLGSGLGGGGQGGGNRGGGGGRGGGGPANSSGATSRATDWVCSGCGFAANFARRMACFECGAARGGANAQAAGGGVRRGAEARGGGGGSPPASGSLVGGLGRPPPPRERHALGRPPVTLPGPAAGGLRPHGAATNRQGHGGAAAVNTAALLRDGPVGADNRRPRLSSTWAGVAARRPAPAQQPQPQGHGTGAGQSAGTQGPKGPIIDADGFQLVPERGGPARGTSTAAAAPAVETGAATDVSIPPPATPRQDGEPEDVDMGGRRWHGTAASQRLGR